MVAVQQAKAMQDTGRLVDYCSALLATHPPLCCRYLEERIDHLRILDRRIPTWSPEKRHRMGLDP